jgi:hypothetical protein
VAEETVRVARDRGLEAGTVGEVVETAAIGGVRYAEEGWSR